MKLIFAVIVFLFCHSTVFAKVARPECNMQLLCDQALASESLNPSSAKIDAAKIQTLFSETQTALLDLLNQRKDSLSARQLHDLRHSVTTVTLANFDDPDFKGLFYGACNRPNAIYVESFHKVLICPSLENYPEITLRQILAHELGHSIQPLQKTLPCLKAHSKLEASESFADWVASKVLSQLLEKEHDRSLAKQNALDSQRLFLSLACQQKATAKHDWAKTHPSLQNRIENMFLNQPAFQEALQCHSKVQNSCG